MFIVIIEGPGQVRKDMKIKLMLMYVDNQQQHGHKDKEMIGRMDMLRHCAVTASSAVRFCSASNHVDFPTVEWIPLGCLWKLSALASFATLLKSALFQLKSCRKTSETFGHFYPFRFLLVETHPLGGDLLRQAILMFSPMWRNFKSPKSSRSGKVESSKDKELLLRPDLKFVGTVGTGGPVKFFLAV